MTLPLGLTDFSRRNWLSILVLSRAFTAFIFMTYAASLPTLTQTWAMSDTEAGFIQTGFTAGFAISLFFASWYSDRFGARRLYIWSCWLGSFAALAFALFARSYEQAFWLYTLVGVTQGGAYTPAIMIVVQEMPPARRGVGVGLLLAGMSAGYVASISLTYSFISLSGYQAAFLVCALGTIVGSALASLGTFGLPNRIIAAPGRFKLGDLFRDRRSLLLTLGYIGHCWELFGMWAWAPAFLILSLGDRIPFGAAAVGLIIAASLHLSSVFASILTGKVSDQFGRRAVLLGVAALGAICSFSFGWSGGLSPVLLVVFAALFSALVVGDSSVLSAAMSEAIPPGHLGRALAVRSILGIGVGALAPVAFGAVLDMSGTVAGWGWAFAMLGLGGLVATVSAAFLPAQPARGATVSLEQASTMRGHSQKDDLQ